ncbi:MAG: hypothetical protein JSR76_01930 [Verrucomicrobia bacterium]|nr:hypothetical protein [Verrucomicrobiota bacterium]
MRLKTIEAFEKHLIQSAPEHRSSIYCLLIEDSFERKYYSEKIYRFLQREQKELTLEKGREALSHLFAAGKRLIMIDPCEEITSLLKEIAYLPPGTKVVLGLSSLEKEAGHTLERLGVIVDLLDEKPWERKSRFQEEVVKWLKREKRVMPSEALTMFMGGAVSLAFLKNEFDKLLSYVGGRSEITLQDVKAICTSEEEDSLWEIAEDLVFKRDSKLPACKDTASFLSLLWQMRYYANLALTWKIENAPPKELKGARLERFRKRIDLMNTSYLLHMQELLFNFELKAKTAATKPQGLWEELLIGVASLT